MKKQAIKRAASVLLALCLVLCLVSVPAFAEGETYSGTCGENLTWTLADGKLTISGTGEMEEYSYGEAPWWSYSDQITSAVIEDGVTSIGNSAFYGCSSLTSITIPAGVTSIDNYAFWGCDDLTCITIPAGVTSIGDRAFVYCRSLTDVYYGGSEEEWAMITVDYGNDKLLNATIHYNSNSQKELSIIIEGTDESYTLGSEDAAVIHCSGALADFVSVSVDGAVVDEDNYDLEEGSTILIFKASYLETLSVGEHTVTLTYTTGSVETTLTVLERASTNPGTTEPETTEPETTESDGVADETNPKTGDTVLLAPAALVLACALSLLCLNRKKRIH